MTALSAPSAAVCAERGILGASDNVMLPEVERVAAALDPLARLSLSDPKLGDLICVRWQGFVRLGLVATEPALGRGMFWSLHDGPRWIRFAALWFDGAREEVLFAPRATSNSPNDRTVLRRRCG